MARRYHLFLAVFVSVCVFLSFGLVHKAKATTQAGSAILSFANLSHEKTTFDVYLASGVQHPLFTNSKAQSIGGAVELPASDWTVVLRKADSAADSAPLYSQKITLTAGEHVDLIAMGSLDGKDSEAFTLKQVTLNYDGIPQYGVRVAVLDLLPGAPEVNIRFGTKFIATHIKYGVFKEVDGFWGPQTIYASPQEAILPDDQNYGKISTFVFDAGAYHLLVIYGDTSKADFVDLHTPINYAFMRFVNATQNVPAADFVEGTDQFAAMQNIEYTKASYWIPLGGMSSTFFRAWLHDPTRTVASLGDLEDIKLEAGVSYLFVTFGALQKGSSSQHNLAYMPIPRKQQNGKATVLILNLIQGSGPVSVVDSTGTLIEQLSHIKYGDFKTLSGVNPVKTSLQFVNDATGKAMMGFESYTVDPDEIYTILLVGSVDDPVGINVPSSPDTLSATSLNKN